MKLLEILRIRVVVNFLVILYRAITTKIFIREYDLVQFQNVII